MQPQISIIVPVAPGGSVEMLLESLRKVDYPRDKIEVIVAEGRKPAHQRNLAANHAKGEYIFFFDDDVALDGRVVKELLKGFDSGADLVGGPNLTPPADSLVQQAHGAAMASFFGAAKMRMRYAAEGEMRDATETDLILCNLAVKKDVFVGAGGFNEELYPNEENVLFNQLRAGGKRLVYNPKAVVYHSRRDTVLKIAKQVFHYGRGRREQTSIDPKSFQPMFLVPSIFLIYLVSLAFYRPAWYLGLLLIYLVLDLLFSARGMVRKPAHILVLPWMFPLIHISYGAGFLLGWIFRRGGARSNEVNLKKVKL